MQTFAFLWGRHYCMTTFQWYNTTKTRTEKYISFLEMAFKSKQNSEPTSSLCHPILCDFNFNWPLSIIKSGTGFNILPPALLSLPSQSTSSTNHSLNFALFKLHFSNDSQFFSWYRDTCIISRNFYLATSLELQLPVCGLCGSELCVGT